MKRKIMKCVFTVAPSLVSSTFSFFLEWKTPGKECVITGTSSKTFYFRDIL